MVNDAFISVKKIVESEFMIRRLHDGRQENERKRSPHYFRMIYLSEGAARYGPVGANFATMAPLLLMGPKDIEEQWTFSPDAVGLSLGLPESSSDGWGTEN